MSFFNNRTAGIAFIIVAILYFISAIFTLYVGFADDEDKLGIAYYIIIALSSIIAGVIYFRYGAKIKANLIPEKIDVLATYVKIVGVITIITGILAAAAEVAVGAGIGAAIITAIIAIILGLIIMFIAGKINDGKATTGDKVIWVILVIVFIILLILTILSIIALTNIIQNICNIIIYGYMLVLLFDADVKSAMKM